MGRKITYHGDHTAPFDGATGSGTVGRVLGMRGRWFLIASASYDAEADKTTCAIEQVVDPNVALATNLSEEWHD